MKPWRVVAGIGILAAMFALTSPVWIAIFRVCLGFDSGHQSTPFDDLYYGCSWATSQILGMFPLFIPGIGIGIWITIFALKDISFVTFKKEQEPQAGGA